MASGAVPAALSGNVGQDPVLRYIPNTDRAMCDLRVASSERQWDKDTNGWVDGPPMWTLVRTFGKLAEHVSESVVRGQRVVVTGKLSYREWETDDGTKRSMHFIEADDVGASLLFGAGGTVSDGEGPM